MKLKKSAKRAGKRVAAAHRHRGAQFRLSCCVSSMPVRDYAAMLNSTRNRSASTTSDFGVWKGRAVNKSA